MYLVDNDCAISRHSISIPYSGPITILPIISSNAMFLNYKRYREWVIGYFPDHDEFPRTSKRMYNMIIEEDTGIEELENVFIKDLAN